MFNDPLKQKEVIGKTRKLKINFVYILETKVKQHKIQKIVNKKFGLKTLS